MVSHMKPSKLDEFMIGVAIVVYGIAVPAALFTAVILLIQGPW